MDINAAVITGVETDHVSCRVIVTLEFSLTCANLKKASELGELAQIMEPVNISINKSTTKED